MIVDDEWPALEQMQGLLRQCKGVGDIRVYDNPREAFQAAAEQKPDILFLDIQMPELSGLTFAEELLTFSPETDIVFVTAYRNYAVEAFELSAADYLLKPVEPMRLLKTWNKITARKVPPVAGAGQGTSAAVRVLGGYELTGPHGPVKWSTHKAEELFAYLWIHRQGSVSIILNDVFPQWNYEKGKQYLHTTVYQIRKTLKSAELGEQIELAFDRENYRLESAGIADDISRFQEAANAALQSEDPERLQNAASLYGGELLQPLDSLWVYPARDKSRRLYLKLLEELVHGLLQQERYDEAEDYALRLVELEPLEESYVLQLISLYWRVGKPLRAQRRFASFRESYMNEMGAELPAWFLEEYQRLSGNL